MRPTSLMKLAAAALCAAALLPAVAGAAPAVDGVFALPSTPRQLALGPDGNVWITMDGAANTDTIARIRPDGTVTTFASPNIEDPIGIVAAGEELWVTEPDAVAHFLPSDVPGARRVNIIGLNSPNRIVVGPERNLWTASGGSVLRITPAEVVTGFGPVGLTSARGIAVGGDGHLYVADPLAAQIVSFLPGSELTQLYPTGGVNPQEVAAGPANQIAVTLPQSLIGRFTPPSKAVQNTDVPGTDPTGIVFGPDGAYWAANFNRDTLTRLTPAGTVTTLAGFAVGSGPRHLTVGAGGTLWVGLERTNKVARVTGVVAPGVTPPPPPPPPPPGDRGTTAPALTSVRLPASLRVGRSGTLRITLSEPATVTIRFERKLPGRRKAGRCVKPRRAPHGRRCVRFASLGSQRRSAVRGANRLAIGGKLGRRTLPVGAYRLTIVATDAAGNASKPLTRRLQVVARPQRRAARRP
jgi:streptogramin lyase